MRFSETGIAPLAPMGVKGFENWLIFYLPKRKGIEVVHLIHGARDIESLLG